MGNYPENLASAVSNIKACIITAKDAKIAEKFL